jgi:hypothetical protein
LASDEDIPHKSKHQNKNNEIDKAATTHDHTVTRARASHKCPFETVTEMLQVAA